LFIVLQYFELTTLVKVSDFVCLSETMRNSLSIAWLSVEDFRQLKEKNNHSMLCKIWKSLKANMGPYFEDQALSLDEIVRDFKTITFTLDPSLSLCFDPKRGKLIYHLWGFLFDLFADESECFAASAFAAKLAGELVHEHEHFLFLKKNELIRKEIGHEYEEEMEQQALRAHIAFLENCKRNAPESTLVEQIKVTKWSIDGKPKLNPGSSIDTFSKNQMIAFIDDQIQAQKQANSEVEEGTYYSESCRIGVSHCFDMADVLGLPIKWSRRKETYPEITIDL
jgi:hypothetical protein